MNSQPRIALEPASPAFQPDRIYPKESRERNEPHVRSYEKPKPFRWEYRSYIADRDADLTQLGQDGWELVAVIPAPVDQAVFYFRRRKF